MAVDPKKGKRKLPDWILNSEKCEDDEEDEEEEDPVLAMLDNTRDAIRILEDEENEWKKDWGLDEEDDYDENTNVLFDLEQSTVMDYMSADDVLEIICRVRGVSYTVFSYPFSDDRKGLVDDLRNCLAKFSSDHGIPYYE